MDWDNLRVFLAAARAGQFVAAARQLKVDHATVNRRITALERALNARLFDRRTTGIGLTAAGQRLMAAAEAMETNLLQAQAVLADTDVELSGTVRIGAPDGFSTYYLAPACARFAERHPGITVQLVPSPQVVPLAKREVDLAIVLDKPEAGRLVTRKLTDYSIGMFASADYLARHGMPMLVEDLAQHRLIGYVEEYAYASALDYARELFAGQPTRFQCASAIGQLEAVRAGLGIGVVHHFIARRHAELRPVLAERQASRAYWIVEHEDTRGLGRIRALHDFIVEAVQGDRNAFVQS
ncbi:LysR family transcriptional regulator [Lichenihabitans sp. Uapishka_5]|uniref:LysR family transcriptional regulator n=1 Tax=Lichenihabitans sp. Uapishka_5 TaxID=3037302 RepID=UPI0029E7FC56|nr:LysR family transcriptional regulator [Lichenihabitans sp. Uapishka_5]MDX7950654.1 LysR family transcriptional regulator [Lichenihabitans sp. Uapishka_5]